MELLGFSEQMAIGALVSIQVAVSAFILALTIGTLAAVFTAKKRLVLGSIWGVYASIFTGVPSLLVAFFFYYAGSDIIHSALALIGVDQVVDVTPFSAAVMALGMVYGAYIADLLRSAIHNVPVGQLEAADVLQVKRFYSFPLIIAPQVLRIALPGLTNMWIVVLKDTALISLIGLKEIMAYAKLASGVTKEPFIFYVLASLFFLIMTTLTYYVSKRLQVWSERGAVIHGRA